MRLIDLDPRWLTPNVFVFRCPHCQKDFLSCKNVVMSLQEQFDLFEKHFGENWNMVIVPMRAETCWAFSTPDFNAISVSPSIDASNSGHWHGHISNGQITP